MDSEPFILRPLNPTTDLPRLAELHSLVESEPVTVAILQDREQKWPEESARLNLVATDGTGAILGYGNAARKPHDAPGLFWGVAIVDPIACHRGIGTALLRAVEAFAKAHGGVRMKSEVRDNDSESLRFAEKQGYAVYRHTFESVLELGTFDWERFAGLVRKVEATGIRFFSFAETDGSVEAQRKLYELNTIAGMDEPGFDPQSVRPFEQFAQDVYGGYWFRPEGQILAADGDVWIGLSAVGEISPGVMGNMFTGVLRTYRGRQIAQALKLQTIAFSQKQGAHTLRTNNDSTNQPMLSINRKLGYRAEPGWYRLHKALA